MHTGGSDDDADAKNGGDEDLEHLFYPVTVEQDELDLPSTFIIL